MFLIDWDDLQLNVPNPFVPGQFFIANVGSARSRGVEVDLTARPRQDVDLFGALGFTSARFADGTIGQRRRGRRQQDALHARLHRHRRRAASRARLRRRSAASRRAEIVMTGAFKYDEGNTRGTGRLLAGQHPRRRAAQAAVRRAVAAQRLRDQIRADRHSVSGLCAVGLHRRERPSAHVRRQHRNDVLGSGIRDRGSGSDQMTDNHCSCYTDDSGRASQSRRARARPGGDHRRC